MKAKGRILLLTLFAVTYYAKAQNVGINTLTPDPTAVLDINSASKGFLMPRMLKAERLVISSPAVGLTVYQTNELAGVYYFDGTLWQYIGNRENDEWRRNTLSAYTNLSFSSDRVGIGTSTPSEDLDIRGYIGAENNFTVIPLYKGNVLTINNNTQTDVANCESGINPTTFEANGNLQVKMIIRATDRSGNNYFQLRTHNGTTQTYPIVSTDSWTWAWTGGGETVTSPWKDWNAGTTPYELHLNAYSQNSGDYVNINAAYLVIRAKQP